VKFPSTDVRQQPLSCNSHFYPQKMSTEQIVDGLLNVAAKKKIHAPAKNKTPI